MSKLPLPDAHEIASGVVADWSDERDVAFVSKSAGPPPASVGFEHYKSLADTAWHQRGEECTGFALAAIANYFVRSKTSPAAPSVSRRMLYEMAQKYDGESFVEGSTLRGALKGWSRVGVAADELWPYDPRDEHGAVHGNLTLARVLDGRSRPLLSYQRIVDERVEAMQHALAEGQPLYVAARTHVGWYRLFLNDSGPLITRRDDDKDRGVHAFVIVGYNEHGFWIHNSWGPEWAEDGYALLPYDDWTWGAVDAWVVDAGIEASSRSGPIRQPAPDDASAEQTYRDMWPHLVVLGDDGQLAASGRYEMDAGSVKTLLYLFDEYVTSAGWTDRKLVVVADGAEFATSATLERMRPLRDKLLAAQIYPIFIVWQTPWLTEIEHELQTWLDYRDGESPTDVKIAAAESRARAAWDEVIARSDRATELAAGGARLLMETITYKRSQKHFDLRLLSFGAGDLLASRLAVLLPTPLQGAVAVAPLTTMHRFRTTYGEMLADGCLQHLTVFACDTTTWSFDENSLPDLVSQVWALPGSAMRTAGRDARRTGVWPETAVLLLSSREWLDSDVAVHSLRTAGRLLVAKAGNGSGDYLELVATGLVNDELVARLLVEREQYVAAQLPRDPLAAAALLYEGTSTGAQ